MDKHCEEAKIILNSKIDTIKKLRPDVVSIGSPSYMSSNRICFALKLSNGKRKSLQYAKILLECHLGRLLSQDETVDHIDGNSMNNDLSNLQVLSLKDNASKGQSEENLLKSKMKISYIMQGTCNIKIRGEDNGCSKLNNEQVIEIKQLQLDYYWGQDTKLAQIYGVSREAIKAIRTGSTWKHVDVNDTVDSIVNRNILDDIRSNEIRKSRINEIKENEIIILNK